MPLHRLMLVTVFSQAPPLFRVELLKFCERRWVLVFSRHHLLLDGWATNALLRWVLRTYAQGAPASSTPATPTFFDLTHQVAAASVDDAYWRRYLGSFASPTKLGFCGFHGHPPAPHTSDSGLLTVPLAQSDSYDEVDVTLGADLSTALRKLCAGHGVSLAAVVRTAWAAILSLYSGERDVMFGTTVSGRPDQVPGAKEAVGSMINTIPCRVLVRHV